MSITSLLACDFQQSVLRAGHESIAYLPFGYRRPPLRHGLPGFNGDLPEPLTGHYQLGNGYRGYNPVLMRFNAADNQSPFDEGGLNAYVYCLGDPVNRRDPDGHMSLHGLMAAMGLGGVASRVDDIMTLSRQALVRRASFSGVPSGNRAIIEQALASNQEPASFTRMLRETNRNLASHDDTNLTRAHAEKYVALARSVEVGQLSNTSAHWQASREWMKASGSSGVVGGVFNAAAALASGAAVDARARKSGADLRRGSR